MGCTPAEAPVESRWRRPKLAAAMSGVLLAASLAGSASHLHAQSPAAPFSPPLSSSASPAAAPSATAPGGASAPDNSGVQPPAVGAASEPASAPSATAGATSAPAPLLVYRSIFPPGTLRPEAALASGAEFTVANQRVSTPPVARLRIVSPDPEVSLVLRFRDAGADTSALKLPALKLTVVIITRPKPHDFEYLSNGEVLQGGRRMPQPEYHIRAGLETDLATTTAAVTELVIQDDGQAEVRLQAQGDSLVLNVVPPQWGGAPSGTTLPYYTGQPLLFLDYRLLAGGYVDNGLGELWVGRNLVGRFNGYFPSHGSLTLERVAATQQALRGDNWSLWLEGGAAAYQDTPASAGQAATSTITWELGATWHWRQGDWGAALHAATINGPTAYQALFGWQARHRLGLFLAQHGFQSQTASALGLTLDF